MKAYGYDFHQTMIAKIEAAQRPIRVRELADFAALYGMEAHELIYPPAGSLKEASQGDLHAQGSAAGGHRAEPKPRGRGRQGRDRPGGRSGRITGAQSGQAAMLSGRLNYLEAQRDKLAEWEPDQ